jgi:hypothetical protein
MAYSPDVDEFIQRRVSPQFHEVVAMLRALVRELSPNAKELVAYGLPMWKGNDLFAFISPNKNNITLGFPHGVAFKDEHGLLRGAAKFSRHVKIKRVEDVGKDVLGYYITQALDLDARRPAKG